MRPASLLRVVALLAAAGGWVSGSACPQQPWPPPCASDADCPQNLHCDADAVCQAIDPCEGVVCDAGTQCEAGECLPGGPCGGAVKRLPSVVLFVVDRSCSMDQQFGASGITKWDAAAAALSSTAAALEGLLSFGLTLFPDVTPDRCVQSDVPVPLSTDGADQIVALLTAATDAAHELFPDGPCVTNIDTAMSQADSLLQNPELDANVVLVTDGRQAGCNEVNGEADATGTIRELFDRGIETVVVGYDRAADAAQLDAFAQAGGRPNPDADVDFYPATDPAALEATLLELANAALDCRLRLAVDPPDPTQLYLFLDNMRSESFSYDAASRTIVLEGDACQLMQTNQLQRVEVVFGGCPEAG